MIQTIHSVRNNNFTMGYDKPIGIIDGQLIRIDKENCLVNKYHAIHFLTWLYPQCSLFMRQIYGNGDNDHESDFEDLIYSPAIDHSIDAGIDVLKKMCLRMPIPSLNFKVKMTNLGLRDFPTDYIDYDWLHVTVDVGIFNLKQDESTHSEIICSDENVPMFLFNNSNDDVFKLD